MDRKFDVAGCRAKSFGVTNEHARINPSPVLMRWLSDHAGFPFVRLPARAVTLLCLADSAATSPAASGAQSPVFGLQRREGEKEAAMRTHALRRSRVHFKCDNSAKV